MNYDIIGTKKNIERELNEWAKDQKKIFVILPMSIITKIAGFFKKNQENSEKEELSIVRLYIGKFVKQNNADIGESIAFEEKRIIIKNPERIISIPKEAIIRNDETIIVGSFDMDESIRLGKEWSDRRDVLIFDEKGMMVQ